MPTKQQAILLYASHFIGVNNHKRNSCLYDSLYLLGYVWNLSDVQGVSSTAYGVSVYGWVSKFYTLINPLTTNDECRLVCFVKVKKGGMHVEGKTGHEATKLCDIHESDCQWNLTTSLGLLCVCVCWLTV